jgi:hypothetical protein
VNRPEPKASAFAAICAHAVTGSLSLIIWAALAFALGFTGAAVILLYVTLLVSTVGVLTGLAEQLERSWTE